MMEIKLPSLFHEMSECSHVKAFTADYELQHFLRRELEKLVRRHFQEVQILTGFGRLSKFLPHRKTYDEIAGEVRNVWIYANKDEEWLCQAENIHLIELPEKSLLIDEPFFLVISQNFCVGTVARSISSKTHHIDPLSDFDILWSIDNDWVNNALRILKVIVPETPDILSPNPSKQVSTDMGQMVVRIISRLAKTISTQRMDYNTLLQRHDTLTAASNREAGKDNESWLMTADHFHERLNQNVQLARRHEQPLSILTLSLEGADGTLNPERLRGFGAAINSVVRDTDFVGRLSQGVIAIGSPQTNAEGARIFMDRLKDRLSNLVMELGGGELTIGLATRDKDSATTADDLLIYVEVDRLKADSSQS